MAERVQVKFRIDRDVAEAWERFVKEKTGQKRGEMSRQAQNALEEFMDHDRYSRIEERLDEVHEAVVKGGHPHRSEDTLDRERRPSDESPTAPSEPSNRTERRLERVVADLPDDTTVSEAMLETPIEEHAGSSYKTLRKYKRLLRKRGHVIDHPVEPDTYVTGARQFTLICEQHNEISPADIDELYASFEDYLGDGWYLEALPDDMIAHQDLKIERVHPDYVQEYREAHFDDVDVDGRGFQ